MIKEWIPDAVYPCEACPCEACPCESREQGVGAGMTNVGHFNFNEYKDIENTYKGMPFFVYFSRVSYIFIIQTYIIFISFKN